MGDPHVHPAEVSMPLDDAHVRLLVDNHRKFRGFLAKRVESESVAEDLLQAAMRKAIESPSRSSEDAGVIGWFYAVLRSVLADHYRSRAAEARKQDAYQQALVDEGRTRVPAPDELEAAVCECFKDLLPTLKPEYAEALRRVDLEGEEPARVASDLGVTENNLSVRLHRARNALKKGLERTCGTCTEHGCLDCSCG